MLLLYDPYLMTRCVRALGVWTAYALVWDNGHVIMQ